MITTKKLNENDIKNLVTKFFAEQGLKVASFEINLTSRCMDRFGHSDEHVFDNITVIVEENPGLETFSQDPSKIHAQNLLKKNFKSARDFSITPTKKSGEDIEL